MPAPDADGLDVLVRGAGPVGCVLALALRDSGLRVAIVDASPVRAGFRPIALSYASRLILERVGAWGELVATPIESVQVSQQAGFGRTHLQARDAGVPALGYVVDYSGLTGALRARLGPDIASDGQAQSARLTVHAEGSSGDASEKRYAQDALVARVAMASPAGTTAFERFTAEGPLALLPHGGAYALIWSASPARVQALAELPERAFLHALAAAAGSRIGAFAGVSARGVQPLALRVRASRTGDRCVYIGNAAQTLHPVAGQGLNLGLRDAWELARILRDVKDPGEPALLARYAARRALDAFSTVRATDLLAGAFTGSSRAARAVRGLALTFLDVLPGPRRFFARRMMYGPSALP